VVAPTGILVRADGCRLGAILPGTRRIPRYRATSRCCSRVSARHTSRAAPRRLHDRCESRLPEVTETDFSGVTKALGAIVAAAAAPTAERAAAAKPQVDLSRKERVRQAVRRHLRTPTLEPKTLARLVGMSRSNLYRLLEREGVVARYIQCQRLLEAQTVLSDPAKAGSISAIAEDLCFPDASSFSRTFRREFGYSPGEAQSATLAGLQPPAIPRSRLISDPVDFAELLRGILTAKSKRCHRLRQRRAGHAFAGGRVIVGAIFGTTPEQKSLSCASPVRQAPRRLWPNNGLEYRLSWKPCLFLPLSRRRTLRMRPLPSEGLTARGCASRSSAMLTPFGVLEVS
jgi:AraC-like DNA-binding protein